ncbi:MAG: K(+)-stimulated pyrophosphate-energized sodium pump, partial [Candidatus Pseudothioglobus sp.]
MIDITSLPPFFGVLGMICAFIIYVVMTRYEEGGEKIKKIAAAIHEGAMVFMHREYRMLALFAGPLFFIIL